MIQSIIALTKDGEPKLIESHQLITINSITLVLSFASFLFTINLLVYHTWLIKKNMSTFMHVAKL